MAVGTAWTLAAALVGVARGEQVTFTGFLTDILCWELVDAVDGAHMPTEPEAHTVHCMRDIQECIDSGFGVLERPSGAAEYHLKYRLDDESNANALYLLQTSTKRANVLVTVSGDADGNLLRRATVSEPQEGAVPSSLAGDFRRPAEPALLAHALFMLASWGSLLPWGVVIANRTRGVGPPGSWFTSHLRLQTYGWGLQLFGFVAGVIYAHEYTAHFRRVHPILGLICVIVGTLQPLNAVLRPHPEPKAQLRVVWEVVHKWGGRAAVLLGGVNIALGVQLLDALAYEAQFVAGASVLAVVGLAPPVAYYLAAHTAGGRRFSLFCFRVLNAKGTTDMAIPVEPASITGSRTAVGGSGDAGQSL